jgi:hypothetical protein
VASAYHHRPRDDVRSRLSSNCRGSSLTDGREFAQFDDGKPADESMLHTCFSCYAAIKARDFVLTRYAPYTEWSKVSVHRTGESTRDTGTVESDAISNTELL